MERISFIFYKEWRDVIKDLSDDIRLELYDCITEYAFTGKCEGLKPMTNIAFNFIKMRIDRDTEKYISIIERNRNNGEKGGRPKTESVSINPKNPSKPNATQSNPKNPSKPNATQSNPKNLEHEHEHEHVHDIEEEEKEELFSSSSSNISNSIIVSPPAEYQRLESVDILIESFKNDEMFISYSQMNYKLQRQEILDYLERFKCYLKATDENKKRRKDCKTHFLNWLSITISKERKTKSEDNPKPQEPSEEQINKVSLLYPENNAYLVNVYKNYIKEQNISPDKAMNHFERAYKKRMTYAAVLSKAQSDHALLFKD